MNASSILYVYFITHFYKIDIAPHHRIEPYAALITHDHVSDNGGIGGYKAIVSKLRVFVFYRKYYRHLENLSLKFLFFCYQLLFFMASSLRRTLLLHQFYLAKIA